MNVLYFKAHLEEENHDFYRIREKLITEFFHDDLNIDDLKNLLNMIDDIHIGFLTEQMPNNEETINEFRQLIFYLIKQKGRLVNKQ